MTNAKNIFWRVSHPESVDSFGVQCMDQDKWVQVGMVKSEPALHSYSFPLTWHYGDNMVRVGFYHAGEIAFTGVKLHKGPVPGDGGDVYSYSSRDSIRLYKPCKWEIYDKYGNVVKKGNGTGIFIGDLVPEVYYLNFDNRTTEFIRKKGRR